MYSLIQKNGYTFAPYTVANVKPGFFESDVKYRAVCILLIIVVRDKKEFKSSEHAERKTSSLYERSA